MVSVTAPVKPSGQPVPELIPHPLWGLALKAFKIKPIHLPLQPKYLWPDSPLPCCLYCRFAALMGMLLLRASIRPHGPVVTLLSTEVTYQEQSDLHTQSWRYIYIHTSIDLLICLWQGLV